MQPAVQNQTLNTSDGCALAYALRGTSQPGAPRLVLIHSLALDASIWDNMAAQLAEDTQILTYDCRGHGRSGKPHMVFSMELFAQDLAQLLDRVGWQNAVVAGCSMGGGVAQAFAGLYPKRASALGLIDTTAWYGADAPQTWRERAANARSKGLNGMVDFQITRWFADQFRKEQPDSVKALIDVFLANDLDCYAATCEMLGDADLRPYLKSLSMPVAIIVGEDDYATPVAASQHLHEAIPQSTLTIIPKGRHLTPMECPGQIASQLRSLFELTAR
jgi:3-oxoadipate enol-lactonase